MYLCPSPSSPVPLQLWLHCQSGALIPPGILSDPSAGGAGLLCIFWAVHPGAGLGAGRAALWEKSRLGLAEGWAFPTPACHHLGYLVLLFLLLPRIARVLSSKGTSLLMIKSVL